MAVTPTTPTLRRVDPHRPRSRLYLAVCRLATNPVIAWLTRLISWKLDPVLLRLTGGRYSTSWPLTTAVLETRGARTGRLRRHALLYFHDGDAVTVVASKRGEPRHPAWYHNLRKDPDVVFGGRPFRAEVVEDDAERQRLQGLADQVFPTYVSYREQARAFARDVPIVRLVPRSP